MVPWQSVHTVQRSSHRLCPYLQAVETLAAAGCDMVILSDANTVFIKEIMDHHGLSQHFLAVCNPSMHPTTGVLIYVVANVRRALTLSMHVSDDGNAEQPVRPVPMSAACLQVYSNEAVWEEGALRVRPFHRADIPHGCPDCPPNLCKGQASFSGCGSQP